MSTTKHNASCRMAFGRPTKDAGVCPRCDELRSGAKPRAGWNTQKKRFEQLSTQYIRQHNCKVSGCGSVCTFGDW